MDIGTIIKNTRRLMFFRLTTRMKISFFQATPPLILYGGGVGGGIEPRVRCPRYPLDHKGDRKSQLENKYMKRKYELILYGGGVGGGIEPRI